MDRGTHPGHLPRVGNGKEGPANDHWLNRDRPVKLTKSYITIAHSKLQKYDTYRRSSRI